MKNVLLLIHNDAGQEARLQAAFDLTRTLSGHLTCLDVEREPEFIGDYWSAAGGMMMKTDERERAIANRHIIEPRLAREQIGWDWVNESGDITDILCRRVDLSDIIVLNTNLHDQLMPDMRAATSAAAVKAHKPILAVPEGHLGFAAQSRAVVAWDGSAPAVAALRLATPVLAFAEAVFVVEIDGRTNDASGHVPVTEAASYLSRHGIHATIDQRQSGGMVTTASLIVEAANELGAAYIVLGAYGHSRMTEAVFGGVTRTLLSMSPLPLILGH